MKRIKDFEDYLVDSEGNVYREVKGKVKQIKGTVTSQGYRGVTLSKYSKPHLKTVHRLVLETYVGECPKGEEACHYDGNPLNNTLSNLRWDTVSNNARDRIRHIRERFGKEIRGLSPVCWPPLPGGEDTVKLANSLFD